MINRTMITAHSGADDTPDNSLEFVSHILQTEADVLEVDVRKRSDEDDTLVMAHDKDAASSMRTSCLKDAFALIAHHPSMRINCDLKEPELEALIFALADQYQLRERIFLSGTVDPKQIAEKDRSVILMNGEELIEDFYEKCKEQPEQIGIMVETLCKKCRELGIGILNLNEVLIDDSILEILQKYGMKLSVWTVDAPQRQQYFLKRNVFSMTTRYVKAVLEK